MSQSPGPGSDSAAAAALANARATARQTRDLESERILAGIGMVLVEIGRAHV